MRPIPTDLPAVLCVAHPGHELRVHGWLAIAKPEVFVLTDGSGRSGRSRLDFTRATLAAAGAAPGGFFGGLTDAEAYAAVIDGRSEVFLPAIEQLAAALVERGDSYLVADAAEGYNAVHDVCRLVADAAVERARARGAAVSSYDFPLIGSPTACPPELRDDAIEVHLGSASLAAKLAAARACEDLGPDVEEALRTGGAEVFAVELLRPRRAQMAGDGLDDAVPFYEQRGEEQVRAGKYARVLRRREHVLPFAESLRRAARGR